MPREVTRLSLLFHSQVRNPTYRKKKAKIENRKAKGRGRGGKDTERMMGQGNRAETWPGNHENAETGGNRISKRRNEDRTQAV